ncbi:hypothetical protein CER19_23675, partial [Pseudomonas sp. GL93]
MAGPDGSYSGTSPSNQPSGDVTVKAADDAGNVSPNTVVPYVDGIAPGAPTVNVVPNADGSVTVDGKSEPGSHVTITYPDGSTGTVVAGPDGSYSGTSPSNQPSGDVTVKAADDAGNVSPNTVVPYVDGIAPGAPTVNVVPNADGSVTVDGKSEPGSHVTITYPDGSTGTVVAGPDGSYSGTSPSNQPSGDVTVKAADDAGNVSPNTVVPYVDGIAPEAAIAITSITTDSGASATDYITSDNILVFNGTLGAALGAGEKAQISLDGGVTWLDSTVSGTTWSYDNQAATLADGTYNVQVRVIDTAGNVGQTASQSVIIDSAVPSAAIAITSITADSGASATDYITNDNTLVFNGTLGAALAADEKA